MIRQGSAETKARTESAGAEYPKREKVFAPKYCRKLLTSGAVNEIGQLGALLCVAIVNTEDARSYRGPVTYSNQTLMNLLGVGKWETLDRARSLARKHGWLSYRSNKSQRKAGQYFVTIPDGTFDLYEFNKSDELYPAIGDSSGNNVLPLDEQLSPHQYPQRGCRQSPSNGYEMGEHCTNPQEPNPKSGNSPPPPSGTENLDWKIPPQLDNPTVRGLLADFARMRKEIGKPIRDVRNTSMILDEFKSAAHLTAALKVCIANEYQGLKPEYGLDWNRNVKSVDKPQPYIDKTVRSNMTLARKVSEARGAGASPDEIAQIIESFDNRTP